MTQSVRESPTPLLPGLWPLTGSYAFLDASLDEATEVLAGWRRGLDREPRIETVAGPLDAHLGRLQPMSLGHRELLLRTDAPWTAYFADHRTGADEAAVGQLARFLRCRAIFVVWWPVRGFEALRFQLIADHETDFLNYERIVSVQRDDGGRWVFDAFGAVQPFEATVTYGARRIRDRLTPAMVDDYCRSLGVRPFDPAFYARDGLLLTSRDSRPDVRFSIDSEQRRFGYSGPNLR